MLAARLLGSFRLALGGHAFIMIFFLNWLSCVVQVPAATGLENQHPLRSDPFHDFACFATSSLHPDTVLRLALPLPELEQRLK